MSFSADWVGAIGAWFSGILIVGSLWFLWIQIRYLRQSIQNSTYQNVYQFMIDIDKMFIENPDYKPYFYSGKGIKGAEEQTHSKLLSMAEIFVDAFDNVYHQKDCMPPGRTFEGFSAFMKDIYKCSPVLQEFLSQRKQWYTKEFIDHIKGEK